VLDDRFFWLVDNFTPCSVAQAPSHAPDDRRKVRSRRTAPNPQIIQSNSISLRTNTIRIANRACGTARTVARGSVIATKGTLTKTTVEKEALCRRFLGGYEGDEKETSHQEKIMRDHSIITIALVKRIKKNEAPPPCTDAC